MLKSIKEICLLILGNVILAFAVAFFILPNDILTGGLAGIAILLEPFVPLDTGTIVMVFSVILLILGGLFLGKKFFLTTVFSSLFYPAILMVLENIAEAPSLNPLLAAVYGGLLTGVGVGLVIKQGSSTGGMDIPPLILHKFFNLDVSKGVMLFDALTVIFGLVIYGLEPVLTGLISVYASALAISKTLTFGGVKAKSIQIISDEYIKISDTIHTTLDRGTTIIPSKGGYTKQDRQMVLVVVSDKEYNKVLDIINRYDKEAFVIVSDATDVHGEGFSEIVRI